MARSIYIASPNAGTGKSTVALGLVASLTKVVAKVGVFRPFTGSRNLDPFLNLLLSRSGSTTPADQCVGVSGRRSTTRFGNGARRGSTSSVICVFKFGFARSNLPAGRI